MNRAETLDEVKKRIKKLNLQDRDGRLGKDTPLPPTTDNGPDENRKSVVDEDVEF